MTFSYYLLGPHGYGYFIWNCRGGYGHSSVYTGRTSLGQNDPRDMLRYYSVLVCKGELYNCYRLDPPFATNTSDVGLTAKSDGRLGYSI